MLLPRFNMKNAHNGQLSGFHVDILNMLQQILGNMTNILPKTLSTKRKAINSNFFMFGDEVENADSSEHHVAVSGTN